MVNDGLFWFHQIMKPLKSLCVRYVLKGLYPDFSQWFLNSTLSARKADQCIIGMKTCFGSHAFLGGRYLSTALSLLRVGSNGHLAHQTETDLQCLKTLPVFIRWGFRPGAFRLIFEQESNLRPTNYEFAALPAELSNLEKDSNLRVLTYGYI